MRMFDFFGLLCSRGDKERGFCCYVVYGIVMFDLLKSFSWNDWLEL